MRDRLIELLSSLTCWGNGCDERGCGECGKVCLPTDDIVILADYLLANGVVVPPVSVGDKVYKITKNKVKECEVVFVGISASADDRCSHFNFVENYADGTFYKSYSMVFDVIGKTVFLTREQVEAKLKEGKG